MNGSTKLALNGKLLKGIRDWCIRTRCIHQESEGSEAHFRNIRLMELPSGAATAE